MCLLARSLAQPGFLISSNIVIHFVIALAFFTFQPTLWPQLTLWIQLFQLYRVIIIEKKIKYIHAIKEISVLLFRTELRNGFGGVSNNKNVMWGGGVRVVGSLL